MSMEDRRRFDEVGGYGKLIRNIEATRGQVDASTGPGMSHTRVPGPGPGPGPGLDATHLPPPQAGRTYEYREDGELVDYESKPRTGLFRVHWINTHNKLTYHLDVDASDYADAAWQVARRTFDCVHPDGRELLDVERLS
jgi:hypothetical protein